jgi:hypothetical protein
MFTAAAKTYAETSLASVFLFVQWACFNGRHYEMPQNFSAQVHE